MAATEEQKLFRKHKITSRKDGGDDAYSWAVFVNGKMFVNGLSQNEAAYYKRVALKSFTEPKA